MTTSRFCEQFGVFFERLTNKCISSYLPGTYVFSNPVLKTAWLCSLVLICLAGCASRQDRARDLKWMIDDTTRTINAHPTNAEAYFARGSAKGELGVFRERSRTPRGR